MKLDLPIILAEDVLGESINLAKRLNNNSVESMKLTKQMIN